MSKACGSLVSDVYGGDLGGGSFLPAPAQTLPHGVVGAHGEAMISYSTSEWGLRYIVAPSRVLVN